MKSINNKGFTIVELLIVIVVIGILAAITIVAYNGVTTKANTAAAQSAANAAIGKIEAYNAEHEGTYPTIPSQLTNSPSDISKLTGVTFSAASTDPSTDSPQTKPASPSELLFYTCATPDALMVKYFDYSKTPAVWVSMQTGNSSTTCSTYVQYVAP